MSKALYCRQIVLAFDYAGGATYKPMGSPRMNHITLAPIPTLTLIQRELLTALRSWKSFALLVLLLLILLYAAKETMEQSVMYATAATAMSQFFQVQIWCLYLVAMTIVPAMAAVSINSERESGNWDMLATTLIPSTRIVLGKYLAVLTYYLLFCVAVLPLTGLVYFYAGVDVHRFFDALIWIVPAALCNAAMGIWASHTCPKAAQAVMRTYVLIIGAGALFGIFMAFDQYVRMNPGWVLGIPPPTSLLPPAIGRPWILSAAYQLGLAALFLGVALYGARERPSAVTRSIRTAATSLQDTRARFFTPPQLRIPDGANPFGFRELYGAAIQKRPLAIITSAGIVFFYFGLYGAMAQISRGTESSMGIIERLFIAAFVPPLVAIAIVREREETTFDSYRITLRSGADLLAGKALGLLRQWRVVLMTVVLCKIGGLCIMATNDWYRVELPTYILAIDLATLPVHLLLVGALALAGASFPKSTVAAIGAASGCTFAGMLFFLYLQVRIMMDTSAQSDEDTAMVFLLTHLLLATLFIFVGFIIALARITTLWEARND